MTIDPVQRVETIREMLEGETKPSLICCVIEKETRGRSTSHETTKLFRRKVMEQVILAKFLFNT